MTKRLFIAFILTPVLLCAWLSVSAQTEKFCIAKDGKTAQIVVDNNDWKGVIRAANNLGDDIRKVTGTSGAVRLMNNEQMTNNQPCIIAGTIGKSKVIDRLIKQKKLDVKKVKGQWESYLIDMVDDNLVTIGMRGDGDVAMGKGDDQENMKTLKNVIDGQRKIIKDIYGKADAVPQLWAIFTEVQRYYDAGFTVPDDVTLLFCDNNWGYIRRKGRDFERNRKGGLGLYYHIDMNGGPWNDRWVNTTTVPKLREQLNLAYQSGIDRIWIINVGDLKPKEMPISFIMDYAWNPEAIQPGDEANWLRQWTGTVLGGLSTGIQIDDQPIEIIDARQGLHDEFGEYTQKNLSLSKVHQALPPHNNLLLSGWKNGRKQLRRDEVFDNMRWIEIRIDNVMAAKYKLKIIMIDPEIVIDQIVVNPDNRRYSYFGAHYF